eukprot:COSAG05_NODE_10608_length_556_cov_0.746171_1_plen_101_part_00
MQVKAKSKYWYFISLFKRVKRINGEILCINEVSQRSMCFGLFLGRMLDVARWAHGFCALIDFRAEAAEGEELRHLDAIQQPYRPDQHVQGVPGRDIVWGS